MFDTREVRATAIAAACLILYIAVVLATGRVDPAQLYGLFAVYLDGSFFLWLLVGIAYALIHLCILARRSGGSPVLASAAGSAVGAITARWQRDRGLSLLWPPVLFAALMASFNAFKQMVLPLAGYRLDPFLAGADHLLFFGHDPWRVTHALLASPDATLLIDRFYHGWFAPMALGIILCAWLPASTFRLRTQYLFSYLGVWIGIGSLLAFLLPSAGPCFYTRLVGPSPSFDALLSSLTQVQTVTGSPVMSLKIQDWLIQAHDARTLVVGAGISAMPSVHNGLAFLFALAAFRINRVMGWLFAAYALLIWIGSIHLGWHYAVDGIAGDAVTYSIWRLSGRLAERLERPILAASPEPVLA
ncbi:MAG TPA: phosphatase PAP2 family protein [Sphingomicrobium sp.]|nr:phosphatase PAP2 family protein [Sphingomicrobium sp.]